MTTTFWVSFWWYWLWLVFITFAIPELTSIAIRKKRYGVKVMDWTLSDCIRRWAQAHHWVPAVVVGFSALLLTHWFWTPS